jgi:hypothetical protein
MSIERSPPKPETFLGYSFEQGMIDRLLTVDELFAPETHGSGDAPSF